MTAARDVSSLIGNVVDRGAHLLFDWVVEPPGTTTRERYRLFSNPVGMQRDFPQTNMRMSECLPAPSGFVARSVHAFYGSMAPEDRELFRERYTLSLWIVHKMFWESPLIAVPFQGLLFPWSADDPEFGSPAAWPRQANDMEPFPRYIPS